jgi:aryl-alcohol dehydrogenase-like predicted oxidoreductase
MRSRPLGNTGLHTSEIGFGAWQLGGDPAWEAMDDRSALRLVGKALEGGVTLFDTSPNYGAGRSERLLGEALRGKRDRVILVSKFGHRPGGGDDFSVPHFWRSLEESLSRLRTDRLDVMLLHNPPETLYAGTDPLWEALEQARGQGKVRHYGASLDGSRDAEACLAHTRSEVLEVRFNVLHQEVRRAFPRVKARGVGLIAKIPLDSGWLTGRFNARSRFAGVRSRWTPEEIARRAELVERLGRLAADGSTLAETALGYVLAYDEVSCVIPGTRTVEQLRINLGAGAHRLSASERKRLEDFWEAFTEGGTRLLPW